MELYEIPQEALVKVLESLETLPRRTTLRGQLIGPHLEVQLKVEVQQQVETQQQVEVLQLLIQLIQYIPP